jgi:hypothetical protein
MRMKSIYILVNTSGNGFLRLSEKFKQDPFLSFLSKAGLSNSKCIPSVLEKSQINYSAIIDGSGASRLFQKFCVSFLCKFFVRFLYKQASVAPG